MRQNKKIAITGGIGSGKTTVAKIIAQKYPVISLDKVYSDLIQDKSFLSKICKEFGNVLTEDGHLDKKKLSHEVFSNEKKLERLNKLTHPEIYSEAFRRGDSVDGLCFYEVPLLFESGGEKYFDGVIVVLRDLEQRIESVKLRDNLTELEVKKRLNSQTNYDNCDFAKYYVIHNNRDLGYLNRQIDDILAKINSNSI